MISSTNRNRGKEPNDNRLFGTPAMQNRLCMAVEDLSHLLGRGYAQKSSLALVGNRYRLNARQQKAVQGMSASESEVKERQMKSSPFVQLPNFEAAIDGFNVLIILESALSEAFIFKGRDGFYRDLSGVHGSYKRVKQTEQAFELLADFYTSSGLKKLHWYFDKPVSNSGRLKSMLENLARERGYNWEVQLCFSPDKEIVNCGHIAISSDAWVLNHAARNFNLVEHLLPQIPSAKVVAFNL